MTDHWRSTWLSVVSQPPAEPFVVARDEVLIVAIDAHDKVLLIEEPLPAFDETGLVLPGGTLEEGETVVAAALRELREETGLAASNLRQIGTLRPWPKYLRDTCHIVLASGLSDDPLPPDEPHLVKVHQKTRAEVSGLISGGTLNDARAIAALSFVDGWR